MNGTSAAAGHSNASAPSTGFALSAPGSDEPIVISDEDTLTEPKPPEATSPRAAVRGVSSPVKGLGQKWDKATAKNQIFAPGETDEPVWEEPSTKKHRKHIKGNGSGVRHHSQSLETSSGVQQGPPALGSDPKSDKSNVLGPGEAPEGALPACGCH